MERFLKDKQFDVQYIEIGWSVEDIFICHFS